MGVSECQADLFRGTGFVGDRVEPGSVFALLFGEGDRLFPDSMFADLFSGRGRRSVAPRTVATVMVLQRWFGLSDREAVAAFEFDVRWRYACGGLALDSGGFCHTVLVGMRARLAASQSPRRIFDVVLDAARAAGAVSPRRVLDSAPIYDAVATQDTVTMLRSAIRQTLAAADAAGFGPRLRAVLRRDDDYASGGKAVCDWEDPAAREALVAELAEDASAVLEAMRGRALGADAADAAELLAAVSGQDLEAGPDNKMRIARRVAEDRVISTTDPDARHGRKSTAGGFDGYKGHIAVDPDSELITDTAVTAGNAADASAAAALIKDLTNNHTTGDTTGTGSTDNHTAPAAPTAPAPAAPTAPAPAAPTAAAPAAAAAAAAAPAAAVSAAGARMCLRAVRSCMATAPMAAGSSSSSCAASASTRGAAPRSPRGAAGSTARTASTSMCTPARSPAPRGSAWRSAPAAAATAPPASARPATVASSAGCAPRPKAAEPSASPDTKPSSPMPAPAKGTRPGGTTTAPRAPKSSASSPTSNAAGTAAEEPACGAGPKSTPTSTCWPPPSTWRASPRSACTPSPRNGPSPDHNLAPTPRTPPLTPTTPTRKPRQPRPAGQRPRPQQPTPSHATRPQPR